MRTLRLSFAALVMAITPLAAAANSHYPTPGAPLHPPAFVALPLGSIKPHSWLLAQLQLQRDGLTGHAEQVLEEIGETSMWRGGTKDNWEKSPYYVKGLIPLAWGLDDPELKKKAQVWVEWALKSQREDGFYGPANNDDWWPRMVSNYFLRDYCEATGDSRVIAHLTRYYKHMLAELPKRPLKEWGKSRAGDDMDTVIWLYARTNEPFLLDLLDLLRTQAYDWPKIMRENLFQGFGRDFQPKHNVNIPQAAKMPAVAWMRSGNAADRDAVAQGWENLMRENGLSVGLQSGTEFLAGRSPSQGIEFCSIVEQMLSDETVVRIFGEGKYADRIEQMAYNALPAAWSRDLKALRYYTMPNHVQAKRGGHGWGQNYDNGHVYGPRSGFPCCCFNVHQGWPKFVQNSWAATPDNGLAVIAYGPTSVKAKVAGGETAEILQETLYPFGFDVKFKVTMSSPAKWPLVLRTPGWSKIASLRVNGELQDAPKPGEFGRIEREWKTGDEVLIQFHADHRVERGILNTASFHLGPIVYSLGLPDERKNVGNIRGFEEFEQSPTKPWNYAVDVSKPIGLLQKTTSSENPFVRPPVRLTVAARKVPEWGLNWTGVDAMDPPVSPAMSGETEEQIELVPFGSAELRVTNFPVLGEKPADARKPRAFDFNDNRTDHWTWLGGGWWAHDGKLRSSHMGGGTRDFRAMIEEGEYSDLKLEASVTPPKKGDAGLVFRVTRDAIGVDAYQGYYAGVNGKRLVVGKADGHRWTELKATPFDLPPEKSARLSVTAKGSRIEVRVEGGPSLEVDDSQWTTGRVGMRIYGEDPEQAIALFDDVKVEPLFP